MCENDDARIVGMGADMLSRLIEHDSSISTGCDGGFVLAILALAFVDNGHDLSTTGTLIENQPIMDSGVLGFPRARRRAGVSAA
jgi:hypothetical protein